MDSRLIPNCDRLIQKLRFDQQLGHLVNAEIVDMPGKLITEKNGIKIIVKGFLNHGQLQRIVANF